MQMQTQFLTHRRAVANQVVERLTQDSRFRLAMESNPHAAMEEAGFAAQIAESDPWEADVGRAQPCPYSCWNTTCTSMFST